MRTGYSVNRIEIVIKVSIEFAAALRAFCQALAAAIRAFAARLPADKAPASGRAAAIRAFAAILNAPSGE